jgi:hypothetical protein
MIYDKAVDKTKQEVSRDRVIILKFINDTDIIGIYLGTDKNILTIARPYKLIPTNAGDQSVELTNWISGSAVDVYKINQSMILTATKPEPNLIEFYINCLSQSDSDSDPDTFDYDNWTNTDRSGFSWQN